MPRPKKRKSKEIKDMFDEAAVFLPVISDGKTTLPWVDTQPKPRSGGSTKDVWAWAVVVIIYGRLDRSFHIASPSSISLFCSLEPVFIIF